MIWVVKEGGYKHQLWPHDQLLAYYVYVCKCIIMYVNYFIVLSPSYPYYFYKFYWQLTYNLFFFFGKHMSR